MATYTVVKGDNLSTIAKRNGVKVSDITGYKSGNPNLIYPGEVLTIGGSAPVQSQPAATAPAPTPTNAPGTGNDANMGGGADRYQQYLDIVKAQNASANKEILDANEQASTIEQKNYQDLANATLSQEPIIRKTYSDLAEQLAVVNRRETDFAANMGEANVSAARSASASAGIEQATGGALAPVTTEQERAKNDIRSIADKYQIDISTLNNQRDKSLADLRSEAAQYTAAGNKVLADKIRQIAAIKQQQQQLDRQEAAAMLDADTEQQKLAIQQANADRQYELDLKRLGLEAQRVAIEAGKAKSANSDYGAVRNAVGGIDFLDPKGRSITAVEYATKTGTNILDLLSQSKDPGDQEFVKDYTDAQQAIAQDLMSKTQAEALLKTRYAHLGDIKL